MKKAKKKTESISTIEAIIGFLGFWFILYQLIILILQPLNIAPFYGLSLFIGIILIFFAMSGSGSFWYYMYYDYYDFYRFDFWWWR